MQKCVFEFMPTDVQIVQVSHIIMQAHMKPKGHITSPSTTCINTSDLSPHLASSKEAIQSLSFSHWFVQLLGILSLTHVAKRMNFRTELQGQKFQNFLQFDQRLASIDIDFLCIL